MLVGFDQVDASGEDQLTQHQLTENQEAGDQAEDYDESTSGIHCGYFLMIWERFETDPGSDITHWWFLNDRI